MSPVVETVGRKFARIATNITVRRPRLWRALRPLMRAQFDNLAPRWDQMRSGDAMASLEEALKEVAGDPRRVLDLGTGTGLGAFVVARRFPDAEVVGADLLTIFRARPDEKLKSVMMPVEQTTKALGKVFRRGAGKIKKAITGDK